MDRPSADQPLWLGPADCRAKLAAHGIRDRVLAVFPYIERFAAGNPPEVKLVTRVESIETMLENGDEPGARAGLERMLFLLKTRTA